MKTFFVLFILFVAYILQTSFPHQLQLGGVVPNLLLSYCLVLLYLYDLKNSWMYILLCIILLETSTAYFFGFISLLIILTLGLVWYLKNKFPDNWIWLLIFLALLFFELLVTIFGGIYEKYYLQDMIKYFFFFGLPGILINFIIVFLSAILIQYFFISSRPTIRVENDIQKK